MSVTFSAESAALCLVGTVHLDPRGETKLLRLFDRLAPEVVTLELSPYAIEFRRRRSEQLLRRVYSFSKRGRLPCGLQAAAAQLGIPFEYRAALAWTKANRARLFLLGDSAISRRRLRLFEKELMAPKNLERLAELVAEPLFRQVARQQQRAARLANRERLCGSVERRRLESEERRLARRIRRLAGSARLVHVGGWEHLHALGQLLSDMNPEKFLL